MKINNLNISKEYCAVLHEGSILTINFTNASCIEDFFQACENTQQYDLGEFKVILDLSPTRWIIGQEERQRWLSLRKGLYFHGMGNLHVKINKNYVYHQQFIEMFIEAPEYVSYYESSHKKDFFTGETKDFQYDDLVTTYEEVEVPNHYGLRWL